MSYISDVLYIPLCELYAKEVSDYGLSALVGIPYEKLKKSLWATTASADLSEKLAFHREASLSAKLATGERNAVGILAILNHFYSWNMPGCHYEKPVEKLTFDNLPKLSDKL